MTDFSLRFTTNLDMPHAVRSRERVEEFAKLLFGAVGYLGIAYSGWCALISVSAKSWPTANGIINISGVDEEYERDGSTYKPVIEYSCQVRGREYSSCKYAVGATIQILDRKGSGQCHHLGMQRL